MGKVGRPAAVALVEGDRDLAAANIARLVKAWKLTAGEIGRLLGIGAGMVSAVRHARPVASTRTVGKALALTDADVERAGIFAERKARADKQAATIERMLAHSRSFEGPPVEVAAPAAAADHDDDIPFV